MQRTIKVWYKQTGVKRVMREAAKRPAWLVTLDGKPLVTPAKAPLELPTEPLAWAVALEWQSQGKLLQPYTMPLTKLASTSIDQLSSIRPVMQDSMLRTMQTDVACIRADPAEQPELCAKEAEAYDALLAWLEEREGLRLLASSSLTVAHPPESLQTARSLLDSFDGCAPHTQTDTHGPLPCAPRRSDSRALLLAAAASRRVHCTPYCSSPPRISRSRPDPRLQPGV